MVAKIVAAILLSVLAVGCLGPETTPTPTATPVAQKSEPTGAEAYALEVYVTGKKVATFGFVDLAKMPQVSLEGEPIERGPTLLSVLELAGVRDFKGVKVTGLSRGRTSPASLSLSRSE